MHRSLLLGFGAFFAAETMLFVGRPGRGPEQPIAYNHAKHIAAGLGCTDCHTGARAGEHATLPAIAMCMGCHESALTQSAEETKLRATAAAGRELAWVQLTRVPAHVYFSHRRHTAIAGIDCGACHGAMEKLTAPPAEPARQWTMDACIDCHQQKHAGTDCNDCHR